MTDARDNGRAASAFLDGLLGLPAEASKQELLELGIQGFNNSGMWMTRAGQCFRRIRDLERLPRGSNFEPSPPISNRLEIGLGLTFEPSPPISKRLGIGFIDALEQHGIGRSHAYNAIRLAEYIESLPEPEARRMLKVPYTKALAIADADPEVVKELLEEGALDGKQPLSVRDLRDRVAKAEHRTLTAEARAETLAGENQYLKHEIEGRAQTAKTPPWLTAARMEFAALTESMSLSVEQLHRVLAEHVYPAPHKTEEEKFYTRSAAGLLYHSLAGVTANAQMLLHELVDQFGKEIAGDKELAILSLDGHELQRLAVIRAQLIRQSEADRQTRALLRAAGKPRGRGRPTKAEQQAREALGGHRKTSKSRGR